MIVGGLADQQQSSRIVEHRAAHADFWRRIAGLGFEQRLDPPAVGACVRRHDPRAQTAQRFIAFLVVRVGCVGQAGLRGRQQLARPNQPVRITLVWVAVRELAGQIAGSVTSADSPTGPPVTSMSESVSVRQVPEISTSDGRNRALYAIFRLSGTQ